MVGTVAAVDTLFAGKEPGVRACYDRLLDELRAIGPFREEPKKTSIHLARTTGFAGVHPRKGSLILNLRTDAPIASARVHKCEQVSKHRYHNEITLAGPGEIDAELIGWLRAAYALG